VTVVRQPGFFDSVGFPSVRVWETGTPGTFAKAMIRSGSPVVVLQSNGSMSQVLYAGGIGWVYTECVAEEEEETNDERQEKEG
jgi:hypothetical protein